MMFQEATMPDGREEREEMKARLEELKRENREEPVEPDDWEPERGDS